MAAPGARLDRQNPLKNRKNRESFVTRGRRFTAYRQTLTTCRERTHL
jgi:hypothetical protein